MEPAAEAFVTELCIELFRAARKSSNTINLSYPVVTDDEARFIEATRLSLLGHLHMKYPGLLASDSDITAPFKKAVQIVSMEIMLEYKKRYPEVYRTQRFWDAIEGGYATDKELKYLKKIDDGWAAFMMDTKRGPPPYIIPEL